MILWAPEPKPGRNINNPCMSKTNECKSTSSIFKQVRRQEKKCGYDRKSLGAAGKMRLLRAAKKSILGASVQWMAEEIPPSNVPGPDSHIKGSQVSPVTSACRYFLCCPF